MLISLIGLPGSGKSTIGLSLARRLGVAFIDSDQVIEQRIGCSIRTFFDLEGEARFRDLEASVIDELTATSGAAVLSTGGGAILRPANRQCLHQRGTVVYLRSSPEEIYRRIRHDETRPLLLVDNPLEQLRKLYVQRDPLYRETAHYVVETGHPSVATLVNMITMQLELAGYAAPEAPLLPEETAATPAMG